MIRIIEVNGIGSLFVNRRKMESKVELDIIVLCKILNDLFIKIKLILYDFGFKF